DTDSIFLHNPDESQIKKISEWTANELEIALDIDKVYRYVAFSQRKKNYLGVLSDGKVDIKGLTGKKSHVHIFIKKSFYDTVEILSHVKNTGDFDNAREEIKKQLREKYLNLKEKKIPLDELAFNVMMSKSQEEYTETTPQHVKVAKYMSEKMHKEVKAGEIISYVKTTSPPGVKPIKLAKIEEIDVEKYMDYLRATFEQILDALGYSFDDIMGTIRLEDFF
ncbi:hypothetical protein MUP01_05630, partial [Candidatus Bathyarchaeota archaeon]|nr:hypothetical protein [Candidatus Bathyarchaeota archaeon]